LGWFPDSTPLGILQVLKAWRLRARFWQDVTVTVEREAPFLLVAIWLKVSEVGEWVKEREGDGKEEGNCEKLSC